MFGFIFGSVCLAGFVALAATRRHHFGHGHWRGRGLLYGVMARLEATPGQEKVLSEAMSDLKERLWQTRDTLKESRRAVARALRSSNFDEGALRQAFAEQDAALHTLREAFVEDARKVHEVLDDKQRATLSELLESGPFFWRHARGHAHHHGWATC